MYRSADLLYFSPTGNTRRAGLAIASEMAERVNETDLGKCAEASLKGDVVIVAAPVFSGRIPALVSEKLSRLDGRGKTAVTAVVYGVRAYEDALLELNDVMEAAGFKIAASCALVAQHSIVKEVGRGRPDEADIKEIKGFAMGALMRIESGVCGAVTVPGSRPYREVKKGGTTPIALSDCRGCGHCASVCPTEAIRISGGAPVTDCEKCIMCMACVAKCPSRSRVLPTEVLNGLTERLSAFRDVRRENEFF